jgi:cytochrome c2
MSEMEMRYPEFTPEEIRQLILYILYQRYTAEKGSEFQGRKLLREKKCFSCHRFGGEGGDIGPDISKIDEYLSPLQLVEAMWNHGPEMMKLFERYHIRRPEFRENDIVDMAVAIRSYLPGTHKVSVYAFDMGNPDVGKNIVAEKGCLNCHSMHGGKKEKGAPAFNNIRFDCSVTQMAGRMWNHGNVMWPAMKKRGLAVPKFDPGEMAHVVSYLFSLSLEDSPGSAAKGRKILNRKRCLFCHSLQNQGGKIAGDLAKVDGMDTPMAMIATMWNHAPAMRKKQIKHKVSWTELSVREMADLYALFRKTAAE